MPKTNKERLQDNNIELQNIKAGIDNLPDYQDIIYNYETISSDVSKIFVSSNIDSKFIRLFKTYCFKLVGSMLSCTDLLTGIQIDEIDCGISTANNVMIDAGCWECFGSNTIVVVVTDATQFKYYLLDIKNKKFTYKNTITDTSSDYKYPSLNPERPIILYSTKRSSSKEKSYSLANTINSDFTHTFICNVKLTNGSQAGSHCCVSRWVNRNVIAQNTQQVDWSSSEYYQSWGCYIRRAEVVGYYTNTNSVGTIRSIDNGDGDVSPNNTFGLFGYWNSASSVTGSKLYRLNISSSGIITVGSLVADLSTGGGDGKFLSENIFYLGGKIYKITGNNVEVLNTIDVTPYHNSRNTVLFKNNNTTELYYFLLNGTPRVASIELNNKKFFNIDDANFTSGDVLNNITVYNSQGKICGTMPNNGALNYIPTSSQQTIPAGYTSGGIIEAIDYSGQGALSPQDTATAEAQIEDLFGEGE